MKGGCEDMFLVRMNHKAKRNVCLKWPTYGSMGKIKELKEVIYVKRRLMLIEHKPESLHTKYYTGLIVTYKLIHNVFILFHHHFKVCYKKL